MEKTSTKEVFLASVRRCEVSEGFVLAFYDRFLSASDEIRQKFRAVCLERQGRMLVRSLKLVAGATEGEREALQELRERAETHDRHHLNIRPELYDTWLACAIETASEYDEQWDGSVEFAWKKSLGYAISFMTRRY